MPDARCEVPGAAGSDPVTFGRTHLAQGRVTQLYCPVCNLDNTTLGIQHLNLNFSKARKIHFSLKNQMPIVVSEPLFKQIMHFKNPLV